MGMVHEITKRLIEVFIKLLLFCLSILAVEVVGACSM